MIIVNGVPKAGGTMLVSFLMTAGLRLVHGGLTAYPWDPRLAQDTREPWTDAPSLESVLSDEREDRFISAHVCDSVDLSPHKVIYIYRHPRNILVSRARWMARKSGDLTPEAVRQHLGPHDIQTVLANLRGFVGWLSKSWFVTRFENFVARPEIGCTICRLLCVRSPRPEQFMNGHAPPIVGDYRGTWSGRHSDWREI